MIRYLTYILMIIMSLESNATIAGNSIAVVVSSQSELANLTRKQVADIFLGRPNAVTTNQPITPIDLAANSHLREQFYFGITGKSIAQIDAYWARLQFSGQSTAPKSVEGANGVLQKVKSNHSTIGYVPLDDVDSTVKVLFVIE